MKKIDEVFREVTKLGDGISRVLEMADYYRFDDLSGLDIDYDDPNERFLLDEICFIFDRLERINREINYLSKPIVGEYTLWRNEADRYECEVQEFYSGGTIECYVYDSFYERYKWIITRVEYNGDDYYLTADESTPLEGLKVRIRRG